MYVVYSIDKLVRVTRRVDSAAPRIWTHYDFRFYSTNLAKWPSRDPTGESDGLILCGFVRKLARSLLDQLSLVEIRPLRLPSKRTTSMQRSWIVLLACLVFSGCHKATLAPEDQVVLGIVLKHFATADEARSPTNSTRIYLADRTMAGTGWISDGQLCSEMKARGRVLDTDLRRSLQRRSRSEVSLEQFIAPPAVEICITNDLPYFVPTASNRVCPFRAYVSFWMPGYSRDACSAVVRFGYGPLRNTRHPATGTYKLVKSNNAWCVEWAVFAEYP